MPTNHYAVFPDIRDALAAMFVGAIVVTAAITTAITSLLWWMFG